MFTIDIKALATNIAFIKRASGFSTRNRAIPELRAVRITVAEGIATVGWFDYDTAVEVRMPANGEGSVAIEIVELIAAIKTIGGKGTATFTADGSKILIDVNGFSATVTGITEDLPHMPTVDTAPAVVASGEDFAAATKVAASAVGTDHTLPMLTGVRIEGDVADGVQMASTDRFKLSVVDVASTVRTEEPFAALVPGKPLIEFGKASAKDSSVSVSLAEGFVSLESETVRVVSKLLDAQFPKFRQLLPDPDNYTVSFTVPAAAAAKQFKAVAANAHQVRFDILDEVIASTETSKFTVDAGDVRGDGMVVAFNPTYLSDILGSAPAGVKATINLTQPNRPAVIEWDGVRALLMPVCLPG